MRPFWASFSCSWPYWNGIADYFCTIITQRHQMNPWADNHIMFSIFIYKVRRINAVHFQPTWLTVRSLRFIRGNNKLSAHHIIFAFSVCIEPKCCHNNEFSLMIRNIWRPNSMGIFDVLQIQFVWVCDGMSYNLPVYHIF